MQSEIGSNFWITPEELEMRPSVITPSIFGCNGSDYAWMSTGRSAISFVLETIEQRNPNINKVAVIPPFTCDTVIEPFLAKGYQVYAYHIDRDLIATAFDILQAVKSSNAGVVLFHRYFGVDTLENIDTAITSLTQEGVIFIEDCTQCLYSTFSKSNSDYYVGSIRKWCGVPDGGFAVCKDGSFENKPSEMDIILQGAKIEASLLKYNYLFNGIGEKQTFLNRYRSAENILERQKKYYTISDLSYKIQSNLDIENLKQIRRNNYQIILEGLRNSDSIRVLFNNLNEGEIPLYCPILCSRRSEFQELLQNNVVYAPIVWPKAGICPKVDSDADYIYNQILCVPIDQRYDTDDMHRVISVVDRYWNFK